MDQEVKDEINKLDQKIEKSGDIVHHRIDETNKQTREDFQRIYDRVDEGVKEQTVMSKLTAEMSITVGNNEKEIEKQDVEIGTAKRIAYKAEKDVVKAMADSEKKCKETADLAVKTTVDDFRDNEFKVAIQSRKDATGKIWKILAWAGVFLVAQLIAIIWYLIERG